MIPAFNPCLLTIQPVCIRPELLIRLHYNGNLRKGGEIVEDLQDRTRPYKNTCHPISHYEFQKQGDLLLPSGNFYEDSPGHVLPGIVGIASVVWFIIG